MRTSDPKLTALQSIDVLRDLSARQLRDLVPNVDEVQVKAGEILIHEGQLNRHAYFVESGSMRIEVDGEHVATVAAGSIVGERTAIERGPANATVRVHDDARVFAIDHRVLLGAASNTAAFASLLHELADTRTNTAA
ncbi:cyclic nucleotide-binding domain-containing protein [Actinospongicola halichondriae]|uniref:cyclic nucleotide-binding domain-containing protein n=1 Tax=Actinospongicola halichondriae TaxID=3236844 RepID=UPI003D4877BA